MGGPASELPTPDATFNNNRDTSHEDAAITEFHLSSFPQLLDEDERPTFVLNMDDYAKQSGLPIRPIFCNTALRKQALLLHLIKNASEQYAESPNGGNEATHEDFRIWATVISKHGDTRDIYPITLQYRNLLWTVFTIFPRWRLFTAHKIYDYSDVPAGDPLSADTPSEEKRKSKAEYEAEDPSNALASAATIPTHEILSNVQQPKFPPVELGPDRKRRPPKRASSVTLSTPDSSVPDWTVANPRGVLSDHLELVRSIDWADTPLGAMETWSIQFREIVCLVMRNPHPSSVFWGEDLTMLYNEAYRDDVTGDKHPALMGTGFSGPFQEMWHKVGPIIRECARTGHAMLTHNQPLPIMRHGYMEESFFTWTFVPVFGGTERILGFYLEAFDTTVESISSRRLQLLRYLGECLNATRTVKEFWGRVLEGLKHNDYDVPFALLYSVADSDDSTPDSQCSDGTPVATKTCVLEGSIGVPPGHPISPHQFDTKESDRPLIPAFSEAIQTLKPSMLHTNNDTLPKSLLEGIEWRGYEDSCRQAMVLPLRPTNADKVCALLLLGINPRRAYDQEYITFTAMLNRQISTSLASVLLFEDEVRQSKHAAEELSQQLQLQTSRMRRMTELSPLGMYLFDSKGRLLEGNERYFEMTGHPRDKNDEFSFTGLFEYKSQQDALDMWHDMMTTHKPSTRELQLRNPKAEPRDLNGEHIEYWVLASSQPEMSPDGEVISIMGSIADISQIKWAQGLQEQRLREAEESKRQQNEFIDITSHEMRNPLSAILICADDIRDTLTDHKFSDGDLKMARECIEAANNIALCVQHQKAIVDDILTVSKLDSHLLSIIPVPAQPVIIIQRAMAMFRPEVQAKGINMKYHPHDSLAELEIDWVMLDPTRLLQIAVNLITNAIKFTQNSPNRVITIHICAHADQPDFDVPKEFGFVPPRHAVVDFANGEGWGSGQLIYLRTEVHDTGVGLSTQEKTLLFEKFAQASPRTHVQYGGSGLGLFISRQLAELHGGQIGVSSEAGAGSTFGFYLKCRRMLSRKPSIPLLNSPKPSDESDRVIASQRLVAAASGLAEKQFDSDNSRPTRTLASPTVETKDSSQNEAKVTTRDATKEDVNPGTKDDRMHVLVVEDNLVNQRVLFKQLVKAGCVVHTADNGLLALRHLEKTQFRVADGMPLSIILIDCEMPEMDGLTCCRKIRDMERSGVVKEHVPIIAVTANIRGGQLDDAKESGMDDVVGKPFRIPDLLGKMKGLLERLGEAASKAD